MWILGYAKLTLMVINSMTLKLLPPLLCSNVPTISDPNFSVLILRVLTLVLAMRPQGTCTCVSLRGAIPR